MRVTVLGSYFPESNLRLLPNAKEKFVEACTAIGKFLASTEHRLIVPHGNHEGTAETHALKGFKESGNLDFRERSEHTDDPNVKVHFDAVEESDAVILIGGKDGTYAAGLNAFRERKLLIPIPVFGGSAKDLCDIPEFSKIVVKELRNLDLTQNDWKEKLTIATSDKLNSYPTLLIIHGRGDTGEELADRILAMSKDPNSEFAGMAEPVIMNLSGMGAISVPAHFERLASAVHATIAIVTADDIGGFARHGIKEIVTAKNLVLAARARENVWVEVGWFWGRLGRERVFLWFKEKVQLPSDLQGVATTPTSELDEAWKSISGFISNLRNPI